jgi:predicted O-methyltransferase YrrM
MLLTRLCKYTGYLLFASSRRGFGPNSPFIYDLVTRVFRNKIDTRFVSIAEATRKRMISDSRAVEFTDLGAGGVKGGRDIRRVSRIAKRSAVSSKYGLFLARMAKEYGGKGIIELGTSLGISTIYLACGQQNSVTTIEGCRAVADIAEENILAAGCKNVNVLRGSFDEHLEKLLNETGQPGLVYIDGDHRKVPLLRYFDVITGHSGPETVLIIDDIYNSSEMTEAWYEIKRRSDLSVTVDIFRMGICFFNKEISPNNYIIRY